MQLSLIGMVLVATSCLAGPKALLPPDGWRYPEESDYAEDWKEFRSQRPVPFHVRGDFNGDGFTDDAWILLRVSGAGWGVFVFLSDNGTERKPITLFEDDRGTAQSHGIGLVPPGRYATACGKGYFDCSSGEPENIELKLPSIDFFKYESANEYWFWDVDTRSFKTVAISD
jgi:hypothetical protein